MIEQLQELSGWLEEAGIQFRLYTVDAEDGGKLTLLIGTSDMADTCAHETDLLQRAIQTQVPLYDAYDLPDREEAMRCRIAAVPLVAAEGAAGPRVPAVLCLATAEANTDTLGEESPLAMEVLALHGLGATLSTSLLGSQPPGALHALSSQLARLQASASLQVMLGELCAAVSGAVSQLHLDASVVTALIPSSDAHLAFFLQTVPALVNPSQDHSTHESAGGLSARPQQQAPAATGQGSAPPIPSAGRRSNCTLPTRDCAAQWVVDHGCKAPSGQATPKAGPGTTASAATTASGLSNADDVTAASRAPRAAVVVPIDTLLDSGWPVPVAAPAANGCHARAFPLARTLLHAVVSAQQRRGGGEAEPDPLQRQWNAMRRQRALEPQDTFSLAGDAARGVLEDVTAYVQGDGNPLGDLSLLRDILWAGSTRSLVLLTMPLDEGAVLAFYVSFATRLPVRLLEAVRLSGTRVLEFLPVKSCVTSKLRGPLAAEYGTIKSATPGSYAVLRGTVFSPSDGLGAIEGRTPDTVVESRALAAAVGAASPNDSAQGKRLPADVLRLSIEHLEALMNECGSTASNGGTADGTASGAPPVHRQSSSLGAHMSVIGTASSFLTVSGPATVNSSVRQRMDLLLSSIHESMGSETGVRPSDVEDLAVLHLREEVGRGGAGVVYRGCLATLEVAVKLTAVTSAPEAKAAAEGRVMSADLARAAAQRRNKLVLDVERDAMRQAMEIAVQQSVSHPNIVQIHAVYRDVRLSSEEDGMRHLIPADDDAPETTPTAPLLTAVVFELCDLGSLGSALRHRSFPRAAPAPAVHAPIDSFDEATPFAYDMVDVCRTLLEVAVALRHLHSLSFVHRDLKPANLLLRSNPRDPRGFNVKISDFGFVLRCNKTDADGTRYAVVSQTCGTVTHIAPECYERGPKQVTAAVDFFAFGIVAWELLAGGVRPFAQVQPNLIPNAVCNRFRPKFRPDVPAWYRDLAAECWAHAPRARPTANQLVARLAAQLKIMSA